MSDSTPARGYPFPTADDPGKPRLDLQALAEALDVDVDTVVDAMTLALSTETQARIDGDAALAKDLADEAVARAEGDADIQQQVDGLADAVSELESVSHRGDWKFADGGADPLPGGLSARVGVDWAVAAGWKISKVDMADSAHAFDGVKAGSIVRFEIKEGGTTVGEAFYSLDDEANINNELAGHIQFTGTLVQSSGRFVEQDDVVHLTIVPAGSAGDIDAYTKSEADQKFIAKVGTNQNFVLDNGGRTGKSNYHAKNTTNGGNYFLTANHNEVLKSDYHKKTTSTDVLLSNHTTVTQASLGGKTYPGTFTASGSTLYWTP